MSKSQKNETKIFCSYWPKISFRKKFVLRSTKSHIIECLSFDPASYNMEIYDTPQTNPDVFCWRSSTLSYLEQGNHTSMKAPYFEYLALNGQYKSDRFEYTFKYKIPGEVIVKNSYTTYTSWGFCKLICDILEKFHVRPTYSTDEVINIDWDGAVLVIKDSTGTAITSGGFLIVGDPSTDEAFESEYLTNILNDFDLDNPNPSCSRSMFYHWIQNTIEDFLFTQLAAYTVAKKALSTTLSQSEKVRELLSLNRRYFRKIRWIYNNIILVAIKHAGISTEKLSQSDEASSQTLITVLDLLKNINSILETNNSDSNKIAILLENREKIWQVPRDGFFKALSKLFFKSEIVGKIFHANLHLVKGVKSRRDKLVRQQQMGRKELNEHFWRKEDKDGPMIFEFFVKTVPSRACSNRRNNYMITDGMGQGMSRSETYGTLLKHRFKIDGYFLQIETMMDPDALLFKKWKFGEIPDTRVFYKTIVFFYTLVEVPDNQVQFNIYLIRQKKLFLLVEDMQNDFKGIIKVNVLDTDTKTHADVIFNTCEYPPTRRKDDLIFDWSVDHNLLVVCYIDHADDRVTVIMKNICTSEKLSSDFEYQFAFDNEWGELSTFYPPTRCQVEIFDGMGFLAIELTRDKALSKAMYALESESKADRTLHLLSLGCFHIVHNSIFLKKSLTLKITDDKPLRSVNWIKVKGVVYAVALNESFDHSLTAFHKDRFIPLHQGRFMPFKLYLPPGFSRPTPETINKLFFDKSKKKFFQILQEPRKKVKNSDTLVLQF